MGGKALKNAKTRRYQADEYHALTKEVRDKLLWGYRGWEDKGFGRVNQVEVIGAYRSKESFGDMDVLYTTLSGDPVDETFIRDKFSPIEIVRNGSVISFDYKELQIDLIHSHQDSFEYAANYFAWNDLGNLNGRIAHGFGVKHGHRGLTLPLRDGDQQFAEIVLTTDHSKALRFMGLDPDRFQEGFEDLREIFDFVTSSHYFNPDNYKLENLNTIAKTRDRKRPTYNAFLEHTKDWKGPTWTNPHKLDKKMWIPFILDQFPEARSDFDRAMEKLVFQQFIKTKFNGTLVSEITGLVGKELGQFMHHLRNTTNLEHQHYIAMLSDQKIRDLIKLNFDIFQKS